MTDEERAALEDLAGKINAVTDKAGFAAVLKDKAKSVYQQIFNEGHASAFGTQKSATEAAVARATTAEEKLEALQSEFDAYREGKPDVAAVEKTWKDRLEKVDKKFLDFKEQVKRDSIAARTDGAIERTRSLLKATIDPDKADALVDRQSVRNRILSEDGKSLKVLQPDSQIPYAGDDEAQIRALAEELSKGVEAKFIRSDVDSGTGDRGTIPGGGGSLKGKARFEKIREEAKAIKGDGNTKSPDQQLDQAFGRG